MSTPLSVTDIQNLPRLLIQCIRGKTWHSPNMDKIRILARILSRAQATYIDISPALVPLARIARGDLPVPNTNWSTEMTVINDLMWPFLASPYALHSELDRTMGKMSIDETIAALDAWVNDEVSKLRTSPNEAHQAITAAVKRLSSLYPQIGLSFGYINNIWSSPPLDDRSFRIFTNLKDSSGTPASFGAHDYEDLGILNHLVQNKLEDWCAVLTGKINDGSLIFRSKGAKAA